MTECKPDSCFVQGVILLISTSIERPLGTALAAYTVYILRFCRLVIANDAIVEDLHAKHGQTLLLQALKTQCQAYSIWQYKRKRVKVD